ncbi:MAG: hypothetical protein AAF731_07665 [Bacteroidota bacterium]
MRLAFLVLFLASGLSGQEVDFSKAKSKDQYFQMISKDNPESSKVLDFLPFTELDSIFVSEVVEFEVYWMDRYDKELFMVSEGSDQMPFVFNPPLKGIYYLKYTGTSCEVIVRLDACKLVAEFDENCSS